MERKTTDNDIRRNRILFDFESIVDLKLSYIKYYFFSHSNPIIDDSQLDGFKFNRMYVYQDPLSLIQIDDINSIDLDHPKLPVFTGMKTLLEEYINSGIIKCRVLCKDEQQERIINEAIPKANTLISSRDKIRVKNFARIVLADQKHILEFKDPITVDFMILNFRENFYEEDETLIDKDVLINTGDINQFTIAKAYPEIPDPVG